MPGPTLVTGAAGFAGSHLIDQLAQDGVSTLAWYRPQGHTPRAMAGVRWQGVDLLDAAAVRDAVRDANPSVIFHCAGAAHVGQSWDTTATTLRVNVLGTHHLVEALRQHAPEAALLITSSALVYGPSPAAVDETQPLTPNSPYGLSKIAQELVGTASGGHPQTFVARPFNHVGPRQDQTFVSAAFARQIAEIEAGLRPPVIEVGNLSARRDLTDVRDTVRAYRLIVERGVPGRPYNICRGEAVTVQAVLDALVSFSKLSVEIVHDPARYRPNDSPIVLGNPARARAELGWTPSIPLEQTLHDLLDYWRSRVQSTT